jgi:hypothetical protein
VNVSAREVFVSYSQSDRDSAYELVSRVESEGIKCWIAPRDITPAADWAAEIVDAIASSRVMVLVFSASANNSPQVRREVERAVHRGVSVLPFRVEDVLPSKSLEYFLSSQHWLDAFPPPRERHYARLCTHLSGILAADPSVAGSEAVPALQSVPVIVAHALAAHGFDDAELRQFEAQLAGYVGPVAKHLVKRAAARASGVEELILQLGGEIESEQDRRQFVSACRQMKHARF